MLLDLQIFSDGVYPRAQPYSQSLFLFPIVFDINLIHFFDEKKDGAAGNSIVCFGASIPSRHLTEAKRIQRRRIVSKSATFLATESVSSGPFRRNEGAKILARKRAKLFANTKVQFFGKEKCKTHRQFQCY